MFNLKKVYNGIYLLEFTDHIDLVSHFMRYQEMYESQNPAFNHNVFQMMDYMRWYIKKDDAAYDFTYYSEWAGFNIPLNIITGFYDKVQDKNEHDHFMKAIATYIVRDNGSDQAYLIGAQTGNVSTVKHEVAHGLFFTDPKYRIDMLKIIKGIASDKIQAMYEVLTDLGYSKEVLDDEIQAFAATGLYGRMKEFFKKKETDQFKNYLNVYLKKNKIIL